MSRKCCRCDEPDDLMYAAEPDDYFCMSCYYEEFYRVSFNQGFDAADQEIEAGEIYDLDLAIYMFDVNPATNAFQYGFLEALKKHNKKKCRVCGESEDVMRDERNNYYCHAHIPIEWKEGEISH